MLYWHYHDSSDAFFIEERGSDFGDEGEFVRELGPAKEYTVKELKSLLRVDAPYLLNAITEENVSFSISKIIDMNLKRPLVFFDLETTGLDPSEDRIVQIAMLKVFPDGRAPVWYKSYVYPEIPIRDEAMEMHNITVGKLLEVNAPRFERIAKEVAGFFIGCDISGYNVMGYDMPLLQTELRRYGQDILLKKHRVFDVFLTYRNIGGYKLSDCYRMITGKELVDAHDAQADTQATFEIAEAMIKDYPVVMGDSIKEWEESGWKREEFVVWNGEFKRVNGQIVFTFGTHKGELIKNHVGYLKWMLKESFSTYTKVWIQGFLENLKK